MKQIISIVSLLFIVGFIHAQPRLSIKHQLQKCLDGSGNPIPNCMVFTDSLGRQFYATVEDGIDTLLLYGLRDTIIAYGGGGGVTGRIDNYVQFGHAGGGLDQNVGLQYNDVTDVMRLDSALTVNGVVGITPTTVRVLKTGSITLEGSLETAGSVRELMRFRPNQTSQGNPDFIISTHNAAFSGARHDNRVNFGFNVLGAVPEVSGLTGLSLWFEDHFPISGTDHKTEFGLSFYDSLDVEYRPMFFNIDKYSGDFNDWFANFQVGYSNWHDPRTQALGEGNYFQVKTESDTAGMTMTLFSPRSLTTKGVFFYYHDVVNQLQMSPFGTANTEFNAVGFPYARFDRLRANPTGNAPLTVTAWDSDSRLTSMTFQQLADSLAGLNPTDSVFSFGDLICIVTSAMDTICGDTAFYDQDLGIFCVVDMGDTTCVDFTPVGVTWYTGNSSFTSNRTAFHNGKWLQFSQAGMDGTRRTIQIHPDTTESTLKVWNKPRNDSPALEILGTQHTSYDYWQLFNGVTAAGFQRDYGMGVDQSEAAFRFSETNLFNDFYLSYYGDKDSLIVHKGIKLDGKVWDEDGDVGITGDVLTKQADGTVNWAAGANDSIPINYLLDATFPNTIDNGNFTQQWKWDALQGIGLHLSTNSTTADGTQAVLQVDMTGTNLSAGESTYALIVNNSHDGTDSQNYGGAFTTTGAEDNNTAVYAFSDGGETSVGVDATGGDYGVRSWSAGTSIFAETQSTGALAIGTNQLTSTGTLGTVADLYANATGAAIAGTGAKLKFSISSDLPTKREAGSIDVLWTTPTDGAETSAMNFYTRNSGTTARKMRIAGTGQLTLDQYTPANFIGASTDSVLTVNATGEVRKRNAAFYTGGGSYTDEQAQDAVGAMIDVSLNYVDATPLLQRAALTGAITASAGSNATALGTFAIADLNTAVNDANLVTIGGTETITGPKTFTGNIDLDSDLLDKSGDAGIAGQVLTSLGSGNGTNYVTRHEVLGVDDPAQSFTNSTTSEQDYTASYTLPANYITDGRYVEVTFGFQHTTGTSTATVLPYVELGGTKIYSGQATDIANGSTRSYSLVVRIQGKAAPGGSVSIECISMNGSGNFGNTGNANTIAQPVGGIASDGTLTIGAGIQYSATGSTDTMVLRAFQVEQFN